jgi:hypothetical protein
MMPISPKISIFIREKHTGETVISLEGEVLGIGRDGTQALEKAKKKMPNIEKKEFLVSHIHNGPLACYSKH